LRLCSTSSVQFDVNLLFRERAPPSGLEPNKCEDEGRKGTQKETREGPELEDTVWDELLIDEEDAVMSRMCYSE